MRADSLVKHKVDLFIYFAAFTPVVSICCRQMAFQTWKYEGGGELFLLCTGVALGVGQWFYE